MTHRESESPLRVLIIVDDLRVSGAQRDIAEEARGLDRRRVQLSIIALADPPGPSLGPAIAACGVPISLLPGQGLLDPRRICRLIDRIKRMRPHVVHTHLTYANVLGLTAAKIARRPSVASLHNVTTNQPRLDTPKRLLESAALRLADRLVVVAEGAREETQRSFHLTSDRVVVIPNAIDLERVKLPADFDRATKRRELGAPLDGALITVVARLTPDKGHQFLLEALATLVRSHPSLRCLLVGVGPEKSRLQMQALQLGIDQHVVFTGIREDVPEILAASDLFVLPSLNEGLSLALLEAMAIGTPVIATAVGGAADVLTNQETGWLLPAGQPDALVSAITEALHNPNMAAAYASRAQALVQSEFAVERHVERLEALYRDVVSETRTRRRGRRW